MRQSDVAVDFCRLDLVEHIKTQRPMKKLLLIAVAGFALASCSTTCDCDLMQDSYTFDALNGWQPSATTTLATDTCLSAGVIDSVTTGGGAFLNVTRVECP
jgi:uncharacterized lipoprotein YajG